MEKTKNKKKLVILILAIILISIFAIAITLYLPKQTKVKQKKVEYNTKIEVDAKKWLSMLDGNKKLNEINIPASHDSLAFNLPLSFKTRCQELDVDQQLDLGIRYLDIRLKEEKNTLVLSHGPITALNKKGKKYKFEEVLEKCNKFIKENNTEFIILNIKDESIKKEIDEFDSQVKSLIYKKIKKENIFSDDYIPRLNEVRGKIIIARRYGNEKHFGKRITWLNQNFKEKNQDVILKNYNKGKIKVYSQDHFKLGEKEKREIIYYLIDNFRYNENAYWINFLSSSGNTFDSPKKFLNVFMFNKESFDKLKEKRGQIIVFDFVNEDKINYIIKTNF